MGSNTLGKHFQITTWGESHGPAIGVVIDGCPAGLPLSEEEIDAELALRRPGKKFTSPRKEEDKAQILSGLFDGKTTGAPISIIIWNKDADSSSYEKIKHLYRPGHAQYTYLEKYGIFDYRGGGRASARETACRVAAGAVAKKLLKLFSIDLLTYVQEVGNIASTVENPTREMVRKSSIFCPDPTAEEKICKLLDGSDSYGGIIALKAELPAGLGDPIYDKLEANLAKALLSIPASKGVEFGNGFAAAKQKGSEHNDLFTLKDGKLALETNRAGGVLGGISTGQQLSLRVAFKPTSSIPKPQKTVSLEGEEATFELPPGSRHDPCVTLRATPVVEAMTALVLADAVLQGSLSTVRSLLATSPHSQMREPQKQTAHSSID